MIIPNWNGGRVLPLCLGALRAQTVPAGEVIVVDNGSSDGSAAEAAAAHPGLRVVQLERNFGFGYAVNRGIEAARGDLLLLLNNDAAAAPRWIEAVTEFFHAHPDSLFCACKMLNYFDRSRLDGAGDCLTRGGVPYKIGSDRPDSADFSGVREVFGASGGACGFRRAFFRRVGLFDERFFMYLEDVDLSLRAQLLGVRCYLAPQAVVYHMEAHSDPARTGTQPNPQTPSRTYWITRNRVLLLAKNYPAPLLLRYLPYILAAFARSLAFHLLRTGLLLPFLRGLWAGMKDIRLVREDRRAIQRSIAVPLRSLRRLLEQC